MKLTVNAIYAVLVALDGILLVTKVFDTATFLGILAILYGLSKLIDIKK